MHSQGQDYSVTPITASGIELPGDQMWRVDLTGARTRQPLAALPRRPCQRKGVRACHVEHPVQIRHLAGHHDVGGITLNRDNFFHRRRIGTEKREDHDLGLRRQGEGRGKPAA